jgi:methylmalonyl-CoA/ethylmalonyl-CoA epimerase
MDSNLKLTKGWALDHVGHAVYKLDDSIQFYETVFGFTLEEREVVEKDCVEVAFLSLENTQIELLSPLSDNSTLAKFMQKKGEGLHHLCYRVDSVEHELARIKLLRLEVIDHAPRLGSRNMQVAFLHPKSFNGILVELCSA